MIRALLPPGHAAIWSDEAKLARWLRGRARGTARAGRRPGSCRARRSTRFASERSFRRRSASRRSRRGRTTTSPPSSDAVAEGLGEEGRWFHYGLTSSDVLDTALALQIRDAGALILDGRRSRLRRRRCARRGAARDDLTIGRTHGVHAEPTTFGLKLAGWAFALERDRARLARALEGMRVGKLSGAVGTYSAADPEVERVACERLGLEPAPSSTQILQRDRHAELLERARTRCATSLERFALEIRHLARTEVREVEEPFGDGPEGLVGDAAQAEPDRLRADLRAGARRARRARSSGSRTSRSGTSGTSPTPPPSGSWCPTRSSPSTTCSTGSPGWSRASSSDPSGCARTSTPATGSYFSQRLLLALVESGLARDDAYRLVQRNAMRAWDEGLDLRELVRADAEIARPRRPRRRLRPRRLHRARRRRLRATPRSQQRSPSMPEAASIVGSGKVREIYALDDERLLLVATRPDLDLRRRSARPRFRTRAACSPGSPASGSRGRRRSSRIICSRCATTAGRLECRRLEMLPVEMRRPRLPVGVRLEGLLGTGAVCGHRPADGPARVGPSARADRHARDEGADRPRREHRPAHAPPSSSGASAATRSSASSLALYRYAAEHAEERGIILADTKFELGIDRDGALVLGDEALTPDSSRFWPAAEYAPGGPSPRSTSSSCATTA